MKSRLALTGAFLLLALSSTWNAASARVYYHFTHRHFNVLAHPVRVVVIRHRREIVVPYRATRVRVRHHSYRHRRWHHASTYATPEAQEAYSVTPHSYSALAMARAEVGTNPTGWGHNWCAHYLNRVLAATGHRVSGSDMASSFYNYGRRLFSPMVGAIAVNSHHVGMVNAVEGNRVQLVSGNTGHRSRYGRAVGYTWYPRWAYSYVTL